MFPATDSPAADLPHSLWNCPVCGATMHVFERFSAAQLLLRSPPPDEHAAFSIEVYRAAQSRQLPSAPQFLVHFFLTLIDYCIYSVYTDEQLDCHLAIRSSPNVPPDHGADPPESGR